MIPPQLSRLSLVPLSVFLFVTVASLSTWNASFAQFPIQSWEAQYGKKTIDFTPADWKVVVDARWGSGLPTSEKLRLFDLLWDAVDRGYGGFEGLDFDIDDFKAAYRPEIEAGVSRGRFAAIMNHFAYRLEDLHTYTYDFPVDYSTRMKGNPVMVVGQYDTNQTFGAVLAMLPDSTLAVYRTVDNHPLGLERGDLILGYEGVPWKDIYPKLVAAELPLRLQVTRAAAREANEYYLMQAAGMNWHLFDTIDIQKNASGETQHLNTSIMNGFSRTMWGNDQLTIPGVPWPNRSANERVGWGIIDGTNIGIVTVTSWSFDAKYDIRNRFRRAIQEFMDADVDGIIIDQRYNTGGGSLARDGWSLLFNENVPSVGFRQRNPNEPEDRLALVEDPLRQAANLVIQADPSTLFDKPIAGLIGPGAISAGELESIRLRLHPRALLFGRPTSGGNSGSVFLNMGNSDWQASVATGPLYIVSTNQNMLRISIEPDVPVWFTHEDIINDEDTVVKAAISWIQNGGPLDVGVESGNKSRPVGGSLEAYPSPFLNTIQFEFDQVSSGPVRIELFDLLGRRVHQTPDIYVPIGPATISIHVDDSTLAPGTYLYRLLTGDRVETGKIVRMR
jgi:Peptidase family S41